mgnify:CR=1 FL=1
MIKSVLKLFGTQNDKIVKNYLKKVKNINLLEPKYEALDDEALKAAFETLKSEVQNGTKTLNDVLYDSFAITREAAKRALGMRHYDVQMVGGLVLNDGNIAEMKTGEGKTLVATLAVVLNAMTGKGVHVVTVNDYLAKRDSEEMGKLYEFLGYSVGCITTDIHDDMGRKAQYDADITYGTNNEYGFDYLRDNMKFRLEEYVQRPFHYAIVDEVDSILIDEARTPLIISGPAHDNVRKYAEADRIAQQLQNGRDFEVNEKDHNVSLTDHGVREAEKLAGVESFYTAGNMEWPHLIDNSAAFAAVAGRPECLADVAYRAVFLATRCL